MDIVQHPQPSLLTRVLRWLTDFERVMELQPYDGLAFRVAEIERRLGVAPQPSAGGRDPFQAPAAREG